MQRYQKETAVNNTVPFLSPPTKAAAVTIRDVKYFGFQQFNGHTATLVVGFSLKSVPTYF